MNRLVTLGVKGGPSVRAGAAMPTSSLLELDGQRIVVDAGLGVTRALVLAGVPLADLSSIFITHLHSDHMLELGALVHSAWVTGLRAPVHIYGPDGIRAYWEGFVQAMEHDHHLRVVDDGRAPLEGLVQVHTLAEGEMPLSGLRVRAMLVDHPPVKHAYAFRFDGSRSVTFSGDTCYFPPLGDFARGSDLLVHEAMLPEGIEMIVTRTGGGDKLRHHLTASHTSVEDAGRIAAAGEVGKLVLNHLVPVDMPEFTDEMWQARAACHYGGPVVVGKEGLTVPL